jgi:lipoate-protein ligase B
LVSYNQALDGQILLSDSVIEDPSKAYLVFCSHPPVVTVGRRAVEGDVFNWQGQVVEVSRGGRATYHGPNQQLIYPIFNIKKGILPFPSCDVSQYLRFLENIMVAVLADYKIVASGKNSLSWSDNEGRPLETTGIWVKQRKIGSVGVAIRNWVTMHGIALNVESDAEAFQGIQPCGFPSTVMTSMEELLQRPVSREELKNRIVRCFSRPFSMSHDCSFSIDTNREAMNPS